jgi:hypothetical protein
MTCAHCGADLGAPLRVGRRDRCPGCGGDLRTCRQCRFYDARVYNECREPQAERVLDKDRGNFCEYFAPAGEGGVATPAGGTGAKTSAAGIGARQDLERLFRRR